MCPPDHFEIKTPINAVQKKWHKTGRGPDPEKRLQQYETVRKALTDLGVDVRELPASKRFTYQVFTRDAGVVANGGALIGNFKMEPRKGEEKPFRQWLQGEKIDVINEFKDPAIFEGGDFVFINSKTAFVGIGDRTNSTAFDRLQSALPEMTLHPVPFPEGYLHLDVVLNVVSPSVALGYLPALDREAVTLLKKMDIELFGVTAKEQETMATNVLAVGKNRVISASCNPETNDHLRENGFDVTEVDLSEILKGGGGLRCMTLPVLRT